MKYKALIEFKDGTHCEQIYSGLSSSEDLRKIRQKAILSAYIMGFKEEIKSVTVVPVIEE